jgi:hypothetical protein
VPITGAAAVGCRQSVLPTIDRPPIGATYLLMMGGMRCWSGLGVFVIFVALGYLGEFGPKLRPPIGATHLLKNLPPCEGFGADNGCCRCWVSRIGAADNRPTANRCHPSFDDRPPIGATHLLIAAANRCHPPFDDGGHEVLGWSGGFCDFCGFGLSGLIWSKAWQFVVHLLVRSL